MHVNLPTLTLSADRKSFTHKIDAWSSTFDIAKLDSWIAFNKQMYDKRPSIYGAGLRALKIFKKEHKL